MSVPTPIYVGCDKTFSLGPVKVGVDGTRLPKGTLLTDGTATYTLTSEASGDVVKTGSMPHLAGGVYVGTIDGADLANLQPGGFYLVKVVFSDGEYDFTRYLRMQAQRLGVG